MTSVFLSCKISKKLIVVSDKKNKDCELVFNDFCTQDWTKKWTLDGLTATIEHSKKGIHFKAESEVYNHAHHAVLWTKNPIEEMMKIDS